jgi:hypothetical protein
MDRIFADTDVGKKNIAFGTVLFLILGGAVGIPLTVDFFGGSMLGQDQYQTWKVIHGYGVFLAFINFFLGFCIDRLGLPRQQKEIASWSFLVAGLIGGIGRSVLVFWSVLSEFGIYASLGESALFILGTLIFIRGKVKERTVQQLERPAPAVTKQLHRG